MSACAQLDLENPPLFRYQTFYHFGVLQENALKRPGGGNGRRKGLKIPRYKVPCRFDSGPGHHIPQPSENPSEGFYFSICGESIRISTIY